MNQRVLVITVHTVEFEEKNKNSIFTTAMSAYYSSFCFGFSTSLFIRAPSETVPNRTGHIMLPAMLKGSL